MNDGSKHIKVSIVCTTYNHEQYIADAIESFIVQKVNFPIEIIIHDDASIDSTQSIIREFEKKYPGLIVPILQTENQYSKGVKISNEIISPRIRGEYVALCEGDDYWCDENKLQKAVDFLDGHRQYIACVHNTLRKNINNNKETVLYDVMKNKTLSMLDVLPSGGIAYHTSSLVFRKEYYTLPKRYIIPFVGDYPRAVYLAMNGKIYYFHDIMSVYRFNVPGSWTKRRTTDSSINMLKNEISFLLRISEDTNGMYDSTIHSLIREREFELLDIQNKHIEILEGYSDVFSKQYKKKQLKIIFKACCQHIVNILHMK